MAGDEHGVVHFVVECDLAITAPSRHDLDEMNFQAASTLTLTALLVTSIDARNTERVAGGKFDRTPIPPRVLALPLPSAPPPARLRLTTTGAA
jgi:hypothetical protein